MHHIILSFPLVNTTSLGHYVLGTRNFDISDSHLKATLVVDCRISGLGVTQRTVKVVRLSSVHLHRKKFNKSCTVESKIVMLCPNQKWREFAISLQAISPSTLRATQRNQSQNSQLEQFSPFVRALSHRSLSGAVEECKNKTKNTYLVFLWRPCGLAGRHDRPLWFSLRNLGNLSNHIRF